MADELVRDDLGRHEEAEEPMDASAGDASAEDGAERAFEAIRAEVAAMRRHLEEGASAPDYSPTLGAMAKELKAVSARLDGIEQHPALRMTPASYRREIEALARSTATVASRPYADSLRDAQAVTRQLEALAGRVRDRREQQRSLAIAAGFGVVGGVLLWLLLVELLPGGAGTWLAARPFGGSRWNAGAALMREADPVMWGQMMRLYRACPQNSTIDLCEAAMAVRTTPPIASAPPPALPAPEGVKPPPAFGTPSARGKVGQGR